MNRRIREGTTTYKDAIVFRILQIVLVVVSVAALIGWLK